MVGVRGFVAGLIVGETAFFVFLGLVVWVCFVVVTSLVFGGAEWKRHALYMSDLLEGDD